MTTLIIKTSKPRNPLVALARFRRAGKHGGQTGALRRAERRALKRDMSTLHLPRSVRSKPPSL